MKLPFVRRPAWPALSLCLCLVASPAAWAQGDPACGDLRNAFGPWDYRKDRGEPLQLVESAHFTPQVEALIRGVTSSVIGQDIDYTLRAFPNHHRALVAVGRLGEREKSAKPRGLSYSVECYYERALRWKSDDHIARMLFASWLAKNKRRDEALKQLRIVEARAPDSPITRYNLGLMFLELNEYDAALQQAHVAMSYGFPRTELKDRLAAAGKWVEPSTAAPAPAPTAPAEEAPAPAGAASAASN